MFLLGEKMLVLFTILALGAWIGHFKIRGISLGATGVLFMALLFGHLGANVAPHWTTDQALAERIEDAVKLEDVMVVGLLLFVYAVGLQAGPRFFRTFRRTGLRFVAIAAVSILSALLVTGVVAVLMGLKPDIAAGLFCGAMTNTPALAAAKEVIDRLPDAAALGFASGNAVAGYAIAYPYSMVGTVLLLQFLPRLLRRDLPKEEQEYKDEQKAAHGAITRRTLRITNPAIEGRTIAEINPGRMIRANISRVRRGDDVMPASGSLVLHLGDIVRVVGDAAELDRMQLLLGEQTSVDWDNNNAITHADVDVLQRKYCNIPLSDLDLVIRYGVLVTRVRRQGIEFLPDAQTALEIGDNIRIVGDRASVAEVTNRLEGGAHTADETDMLPFLVGLLLGIALGVIPFQLFGMKVKLGVAGGAFVMSLIIGHFGRIGRWHLYVPPAAKNISRELGLMLFLAGAGTSGGEKFAQVFTQYGWQLLAAGALVTTVSVSLTLILMLGVFRMRLSKSSGALAACMTNPPALGVANAQTQTDMAVLGWASVYPLAMIFKVLFVQLLVPVLYALYMAGQR